MNQYRITKYNPALRDSLGAYTRLEWTSFSDIGRVFDGVVLPVSTYQQIEDAYATTAVAMLREANVASLTIADLENHADVEMMFAEGSTLRLAEIDAFVRRMLREEFWCRLQGAEAFVHVGYDYYMFIGVPCPCPEAEALARRLGLFVEPFPSPYNA